RVPHAALRRGARAAPAAIRRGVPLGAVPARALAGRAPGAGVPVERARRDALLGDGVPVPAEALPRGVPLPGARPLRALGARADGGDDAERRPLLLLASVRLVRAGRRRRTSRARARRGRRDRR